MTKEKSRGFGRQTFAPLLMFILAAAPMAAASLELHLETPGGERPASDYFSPADQISLNELQVPVDNPSVEPLAPLQDANLAPQLSPDKKTPALIRASPSPENPVSQTADSARKRWMAKNIAQVKQFLGRLIKNSASGSLEERMVQGQFFDQVLSEDGGAQNAEVDLSPTSFPEGLTRADLNRATSHFLADWIKFGLKSSDLARALPRIVFKDKSKKKDWEILAKTLIKNPGSSRRIFWYIYNNLEQIVFSEKSSRERAAVASHAAKRYARFFAQAAQDKSLPAFFRSQAAESEKLLADGSLVQALLLERQSHNQLISLNALIPKDADHAESGEDGLMIPSWEIPPPTTQAEREKIREERGEQETRSYAMPDAIKEIAVSAFVAQKALARTGILGQHPFSEKFKERIQGELKDVFSYVRSSFLYDDSFVTRIRDFTIFKGFFKGKKRKICSRALHEGLDMVERAGQLVIRAHFLTDILDEEVLRAVKASIEDYWRGEFSYRGKNYRIETDISFEPIDSGKMIAENVLQLLDGGNANSHVNGPVFYLERNFEYGVPAHEFGHILGLNDEYVETYDFSRHSLEALVTMNSLMNSSQTGEALPRHFKTVYQLQRRRAGK